MHERVEPLENDLSSPEAAAAAPPEIAVVRAVKPTTDAVSAASPQVAVGRMEEVAYDPYAERRRRARKVLEMIYVIFGIVETLIALRVILRALGANPGAAFAQLIYSLSAPLDAPFAGLFTNPQIGDGVLELHSIMALIVYALLAWLVGKLFWLLFGEPRSAVKAVISSVDTRVAR